MENNYIFNKLTELVASQGYRVLVIEQTETPEQLDLRRKETGVKDKVCFKSYGLTSATSFCSNMQIHCHYRTMTSI